MPIINTVIAGGGTTPTGTKSITTNGTHDVTNYASADVQVPTTAPAHYVEKSVNANGKLVSGTSVIDLTGVTTIGAYALAYAYSCLNTSEMPNFPPFNNVDIDWSGILGVEVNGLSSCFYGRKGINSFKFGAVNGRIENCESLFREAGLKKIEILSSVFGDYSSMIALDCTQLIEAKFPNVTQMVGTYAGYSILGRCTALSGVLQFPNLELIEGTSTYGAGIQIAMNTNISRLEMPKLKTIKKGANSKVKASGYQMCGGCQNMTSFYMPALEQIGPGYSSSNGCCGSMFSGCTSLIFGSFPSLKNIESGCGTYMFLSDTSLQSLWFYALQTLGSSALDSMLSGCTNVTVHFPIALQSTYSSDTRFTGGFGGTNTTVLFDLVQTLTGADTNTYTRQEKDSTATATAWNDGNDVLFYTSGVSDNTNGVNEPAVNDTIYSDAACTTAVTTISAIA